MAAAIFFIAYNRMMDLREMDPYLIFSAGEEVDLKQGKLFPLLNDRVGGVR